MVGNQWTGGVPTDFISSDIGSNVGSTTNVTVTGAESSWSNPIGGMAVGEAGDGFVTIADGGHVTSPCRRLSWRLVLVRKLSLVPHNAMLLRQLEGSFVTNPFSVVPAG